MEKTHFVIKFGQQVRAGSMCLFIIPGKAAAKVGMALAEAAKKAGVTSVVFDRGGFLFHGRVKALADAAREGGLEF